MMINQAKDVVRRVAAGNGKQSPEHLLNNASNKVVNMMIVMIINYDIMIMMMRIMRMMLLSI